MQTSYIFISNGYRGGASNFLINHIEYLSKKKKNIILIDDNPYKTFEKIPNLVKIKRIKINIFSFKEKEKLKKELFNKINNKVVFITNYAFPIKYFLLFKNFKKKNIKVILTLHSGLFNLNFKKYIAGLFFSFIYKKIDYLYFGSNSAKDWWKKNYPWMDISKNLIMYNGVSVKSKKKIKKINKKIIISFVGRLENENNPKFFIDIAERYLELYNNAIFNLYGDGPMLKDLKKKNRNKNINFFGWVNKDVIYKKSNIVLITSPINNFPYVALEAKSYGIPVISSSKGDIKKIVKNNVDGFISETNSINKMITLIEKTIKNYNPLSKNAIKRSKKFDIKESCKKFWQTIK